MYSITRARHDEPKGQTMANEQKAFEKNLIEFAKVNLSGISAMTVKYQRFFDSVDYKVDISFTGGKYILQLHKVNRKGMYEVIHTEEAPQ